MVSAEARSAGPGEGGGDRTAAAGARAGRPLAWRRRRLPPLLPTGPGSEERRPPGQRPCGGQARAVRQRVGTRGGNGARFGREAAGGRGQSSGGGQGKRPAACREPVQTGGGRGRAAGCCL